MIRPLSEFGVSAWCSSIPVGHWFKSLARTLPGDHFIVISLRIAILFFLPIPVLRTAAANHWVHRGQNSLLNNLFSSLFRVRFRPVAGEQTADLSEERTARVVRWRWLHLSLYCHLYYYQALNHNQHKHL